MWKQSNKKDKGHSKKFFSAHASLKFFTVKHFRDTIVKNNNLDPSKFTFVDPIVAAAGTSLSAADSQMVTNFETLTKKTDGKIADLTSRISQLTTKLNHVTVTVNQIATHTGAVTNQARDITAPATPAPSDTVHFDDILSP